MNIELYSKEEEKRHNGYSNHKAKASDEGITSAMYHTKAAGIAHYIAITF